MANHLLIGAAGNEVTGSSEWDATWEQRIDGVGTATVTVQDRGNDPTVNYGRRRDPFEIHVGGLCAFIGEITNARVELPPGRPWRRWKISASDLNTIFDLRLIGVPDGTHWQTIDGGATYEPYDPDAKGLSRDGDTIKHLIATYANLPALWDDWHDLTPDDPVFFTTRNYVHNFIPRSVMMDPASGQSRLSWTQTTLRAALDEMRGLAGFPIFYWIAPDDAHQSPQIHWTVLPDPITGRGRSGTLMHPRVPFVYAAPAIITDSSPNGTTSVGGRDLFIEYDATYMPEQAYVGGVTDYIRTGGGGTRYQGTGFAHRAAQDPSRRQILVDAQSVTEAQKDAVAKHYQKFGSRARIKGSVTVGRPDESVDGWRVGQMVQIIDARLPAALSGTSWPIQAVKGRIVAGLDHRVYTLEFGDAPIGRFSEKYRQSPQRLPTSRIAAREHIIHWPTTHLRPSSEYVLTSQMVDRSTKPVRHAGVPVVWSLVAKDRTGATVGQGSVAVHTSVTNAHGRTSATLTTGTGNDIHYHVSCTTAAQ